MSTGARHPLTDSLPSSVLPSLYPGAQVRVHAQRRLPPSVLACLRILGVMIP